MTSILMEDFLILASSRTPPLQPPPEVAEVDSPPPSKHSCVHFCLECESGYSWYDMHGKGGYSDAFRASLARPLCSL